MGAPGRGLAAFTYCGAARRKRVRKDDAARRDVTGGGGVQHIFIFCLPGGEVRPLRSPLPGLCPLARPCVCCLSLSFWRPSHRQAPSSRLYEYCGACCEKAESMFGTRNAATATPALSAETPLPDLSSFEAVLGGDDDDDDDDDEVDDAAVDAVLKDLLKEKDPPKAAVKTAVEAPRRLNPRTSCSDRVEERIQEYASAALAAQKRGDRSEAGTWLQHSKDLVAAVDALLQSEFLPPGAAPVPKSTTPVPQAIQDAPAVAGDAVAPVARLESDEHRFDYVSLRVVEHELQRLAADATAVAALQKRRATLETLERRHSSDSAPHSASYAQRLKSAIENEKERARTAKRDGDTREALNALRRAKIMQDELEAS